MGVHPCYIEENVKECFLFSVNLLYFTPMLASVHILCKYCFTLKCTKDLLYSRAIFSQIKLEWFNCAVCIYVFFPTVLRYFELNLFIEPSDRLLH